MMKKSVMFAMLAALLFIGNVSGMHKELLMLLILIETFSRASEILSHVPRIALPITKSVKDVHGPPFGATIPFNETSISFLRFTTAGSSRTLLQSANPPNPSFGGPALKLDASVSPSGTTTKINCKCFCRQMDVLSS